MSVMSKAWKSIHLVGHTDEMINPARAFIIADHAVLRTIEMGIKLSEVVDVVTSPAITYPDKADPQREIRVGGRLAVVCEPSHSTVVTVMWHLSERRSDGPAVERVA